MNIIPLGKFYVCSRSRITEYLEKHGFHYFTSQIDRQDPLRTVWIYHVSDELIDCLNGYEIMRNHDRRFVAAAR